MALEKSTETSDGAKILVVEDDPDMNEVLVSTLTEMGYDVSSVQSGPKAIEHCKEHSLDLVLTDVRLPGMDGVEALAEIKKLQPRVKCIVITGYASEDTPVRAIRLSVDDYLFKPFSLKYFADSVTRVLAGSSGKKTKWALFQKVFSILGPSKDRGLERLVLQREDAFRALFVGVRSKCVSQDAALAVYTKLELLEKSFRALLNSANPKSADMKKVRDEYTNLHDHLWEFEFNFAHELSDEDRVPADQFEKLYVGLVESEVGLEELQYAPLLRTSPNERFETLPEMLEFKKKLWPGLA